MKKRLQGILACALLCALLAAALPAPASAADFADVPATHWAAEAIDRAAELGIIRGQSASRFGLGQPMTRGAFVTVLCRLFGWEMITPEQGSYTDNQDKDASYYSAVETARAHGAITDQTDTFRPRDAITREELAVMLVRAMGYGTIAGLAQDLPIPFQDVTTNVGYVAMAYELGLIKGTSGSKFSPDIPATREQATVMLMRLYDGYHTAAPERIGIADAAEELTDLTGYEAVAVNGGRLIHAGGTRLTGQPEAEAADALREAAEAAGAAPLLYLTATSSVLRGDPEDTARLLAQAVEDGGYQGLFLDVEKLQSGQKKEYTELADRLVIRVAPYERETAEFPVAPMEPLEEVYYALAELRGQVDGSKLSLLLTTTGSAWNGGRSTGEISAAEIKALLDTPKTQSYYADRYACAYLTAEDGAAVWYLDGRAARERVRMAAFFGVDQVCLSDLASVADYDNYSLLSGLN